MAVSFVLQDANASHKKKPIQSAPTLQQTIDLSNYVTKTQHDNDIINLQSQVASLQFQLDDIKGKLAKSKDAPENKDKE